MTAPVGSFSLTADPMAPPGISPLTRTRAGDLIERLGGHHILVAGDVMLDRFIVGRVSRISPEAPVPVVHFQHQFVRLGGAANVAHNLAALGARVTLVGVVGNDQAADRVRAQLDDVGIGIEGLVVDPMRPTVEKVRIVTDRHQQVARVDYEQGTDVTGETERQLAQRITACGCDAEVLVVSDYVKGAVTERLMSAVQELRRARPGVPLLVDPKIPHLDRYAGATLITPNHHEAEAATERPIRDDRDARSAAQAFRARTRCGAVLITRGEHGMWLSSPDAEGSIPALAREVSDVTGAGDTVMATLALATAAGATMAEAAMLANIAAGVVVGKFGPATVGAAELIEYLGGLA